MPKIVHPIAGTVALLTIACFWLSTALTELFGSQATIVAVKTAIPWGFLILVPAMALTGASGLKFAKGRRGGVLGDKARRMPIIAANGVLVLIPAALFLGYKASHGQFDTAFYVVQVAELIAGAVNITLLARSMRDGLKMKGRLRRRPA